MEFKENHIYLSKYGTMVLCTGKGERSWNFSGKLLMAVSKEYPLVYESSTWGKEHGWEDLGELKNDKDE